jgi:hypothetical protein
MIRLEQPSMVINDHRVENNEHSRVRYQMWNTWDLFDDHKPTREIAQSINEVASSAPGGRLRNLVLNCHGEPGMLALGQYITRHDLHYFDILRGKIDTVYILACLVARITDTTWVNENVPATLFHGNSENLARSLDGNIFCSELARRIHCTVVVSNAIQTTSGTLFPYGVIDEFEGLVLWYGPAGNVLQWERYPYNPVNTTEGPRPRPNQLSQPLETSWGPQTDRTRKKFNTNIGF